MSDDIKTGTDAIRAALKAKAYKGSLAQWSKQELSLSSELLDAFIRGHVTLPGSTLKLLTTELWHGHVEYVPEQDVIRPVPKPEPVVLAPARPGPFVPRTDHLRPHQTFRVTPGMASQAHRPRPGWAKP